MFFVLRISLISDIRCSTGNLVCFTESILYTNKNYCFTMGEGCGRVGNICCLAGNNCYVALIVFSNAGCRSRQTRQPNSRTKNKYILEALLQPRSSLVGSFLAWVVLLCVRIICCLSVPGRCEQAAWPVVIWVLAFSVSGHDVPISACINPRSLQRTARASTHGDPSRHVHVQRTQTITI